MGNGSRDRSTSGLATFGVNSKDFLPGSSLFRQIAFGPALEESYEREQVLATLVAGVLCFMLFFAVFVDSRIRNDFAPLGIVSFEFAASGSRAARMIGSWNAQQRMLVAFSLGADMLFIPVYSIAIGYASLWAADLLRSAHTTSSSSSKNNRVLADVCELLGNAQWVAGLFDAAENMLLLYGLLCTDHHALLFDFVFPVAAMCASIKFLIALTGAVLAGTVLAQQRNKPRTFTRRSSSKGRLH